MYSILSLSPLGHLHINQSVEDGGDHQDIHDNNIIRAFSKSTSDGLFALARASNTDTWPTSLHYWRRFSAKYLNILCRQAATQNVAEIAPPEEHECDQMILNLPPMPGAEYYAHQVLYDLWSNFDVWIRNEIACFDGDFQKFLATKLPQWHQVGRVCFHLAENKKDPDYPFAFIATYAPSIGTNARVQYQPLHHALQEYASDGNKQQLVTLLKPILKASKQCTWIQGLLDSRDIYHPLAWTPQEAYTFLNSVPLLENSGLIVRLPNWWKRRPRPRVQVSIGSTKKKSFDMNAILDFKLGVAIDGTPLTKAELDYILSSKGGLISLRGQWIEVDKEKLQQALDHWQTVQSDVEENGLSFIEGMRLLAGADKELLASDASINGNDSWAYVDAGSWLKELLTKLRHPDTIKMKRPGKLLKAKLRPYQVVGVNWLDFLTELGLGSCLADDMGLGKTIQVIALLLIKKQQYEGKHRPSILVLPASLLSNWKSELERFSPSLKALYLHASEISKNRISDIASDVKTIQAFDIVLTTYGMVLRQPWLQEQPWRLVILDEAQAIKNPTARQTKAVKHLKGDARIALTGTPIENRLGDLWSLFDFLCSGLLGSATRFKKYIKQINTDENQSFGPLRKLVQPYILRRLKTDKRIINDLPDKIELVGWCGLSKEQAALYAQAVNELSDAIDGENGIKRRGLVLSYLMRFKQICNHPSHALGDGLYEKNKSGKFLRLAEICEEIASRQEKVLIFTQFREITKPLSIFLRDVFNRPGLVLTGSTPVKKRKPLVDQFQQENGPPFFVLSLKAAGTGLNLTAANHVIHFDRWWNPAVENQATDRAFRIGQKKNVLVHKFVCRGTVEEKIHTLINEKVQLAADVLCDSGEALLTELDDNALLDLVSLDLEKTQF